MGEQASRRSADQGRLVRLLRDRSLELGSFRLASGATSGYYIDARRTTMSADGLDLIGALAISTIHSAGWIPQFVGGLTLGADPVAYAIAMASHQTPPVIDAFTVRKERKQHGTRRSIEGCFEAGARVVVVEDVLTTGSSVLQAIETLREQQAVILGVLAVVDRQEGGRQRVEESGVRVKTLVTARDLGVGDDSEPLE